MKKCTFRVKNEKKFVYVTQKFVFVTEITNVRFCNPKVRFCNPVFDLGYKNEPFWVTKKNISTIEPVVSKSACVEYLRLKILLLLRLLLVLCFHQML